MSTDLINDELSKQQVHDIYWFIDWVMNLPEEVAEQFDHELQEFEKEKKMSYATTMERRGIKKALKRDDRKANRRKQPKLDASDLSQIFSA